MEAASPLYLQHPAFNFLFFSLGLLLFQSMYMLAMLVLTRRKEFLGMLGTCCARRS